MDVIRDHYNLLWKLIIRPPRDKYDLKDLGPARFLIKRGGPIGYRTELELKNDRGLRLQCSYFRPEEGPRELPVVVYLHGNCSSRVECLDVLECVLSRGMGLFTVDLSGSGKSGGEYISLGWFERDDVKCVVQHLREAKVASAVGLWGRSMGGATSVLYAGMDPSLAGIVADSAFGSLPKVAEELVNSGGIPVPGFLLRLAMDSVKTEVEDRAGFDIYELVPLDGAAFTQVPALLATAKNDTFVLPHHTRDIFAAWACEDKELVEFNGGHNSERPDWWKDKAADFLLQRLRDAAARPAPPPGSPPRAPAIPAGALEKTELQRLKEKEQQAREEMEKSRPERLRAVAEGVIMLGFSEECGWEAARRHSSVEAAVEWLLQLSEEASNTLKAPLSMAQVPHSRPLTIQDLRAADAAGALGATVLAPPCEDLEYSFAPRPRVSPDDVDDDEALPLRREVFEAVFHTGRELDEDPRGRAASDGARRESDRYYEAVEELQRRHSLGAPDGKEPVSPEVGLALNRAVIEAKANSPNLPNTRAIADLKRELINFGVREQAASDAAKRHSTIEAAVEWLIARGEM